MISLRHQFRGSIFENIRSNVNDRIRYTLNALTPWNIENQMWVHFNLIDTVDDVTYAVIVMKVEGTSI